MNRESLRPCRGTDATEVFALYQEGENGLWKRIGSYSDQQSAIMAAKAIIAPVPRRFKVVRTFTEYFYLEYQNPVVPEEVAAIKRRDQLARKHLKSLRVMTKQQLQSQMDLEVLK
jgi:hypothetical protein